MRKKYFIVSIVILLFSISYSQDFEWRHDSDIIYVRPLAEGSGLVRDVPVGDGNYEQIITGQITLGVESRIMARAKGDDEHPFPAALRYRFVLHQPDNDGKDVQSFISDILTGQSNINWNSALIPDGSYALSLRLYSGGLTEDDDISRFRTRPLVIIVDNDQTPITGSQWIPSCGFAGMRARNYDGTGVDWLWYSGWSLPNSNSYTYNTFAPPQSDLERQQLASDNEWFTETLWGALNSRYDKEPRFCRTNEGHVIIDGTNTFLANSSKRLAGELFYADGPRNKGGVIGPSTIVANAKGPGIIGATHGDRLFFAGPDGITTIAGYSTKPDGIPCLTNDCDNSIIDLNKVLIGDFTNNELFGFSKQSELVFDTNDNNKIYAADTYNHRIALIEVNGCDENYQNCDPGYPKISTLAGSYGNSGNADGSLANARFDDPCGIAIIDRILYIADRSNKSIRQINLDTETVSTVDNTTFDDPYVVRRTSDKNLVVKSGRPIYFLNLSDNSSYKIFDAGKDDRMGMDVDWRGNLGPIDNIIYPGWDDDHGIGRVGIDGSGNVRIIQDSGYPFYFSDAMGGGQGSYVLQTAVDDEEARVFLSHTYRERPTVIRPLMPDDPKDFNTTLSQRGKYIYHYGTVQDFNQHWQRSSFASIHGTVGHHWLGNTIPTFDELALLTDLELAEYIQNGMAGNIQRPEITGIDLQAVIYYIKILSLPGKTQAYDPDDIKQNLAGTDFWPDVNDFEGPGTIDISVVDLGDGRMQIDWNTDEAALGVITYGTSRVALEYNNGPTQQDVYGLFSEMETTYTQAHSLIVENIPPEQQMKFKVISRDKAGNIGISWEMNLAEGTSSNQGPSPPKGLKIR